jgi:uncharacterized protein
VKFVADGMLGKLTRWLRLIGQDVEYSNQMGDSELIETAKTRRRILLTKDLELYQRASAKNVLSYYIETSTEPEKIAELAHRFKISLKIDMKKSRCPMCNTKIKHILKKHLAGKVEKNTFAAYDEFWICLKCDKVYWQGAHWGRIRVALEKAEEMVKKAVAA